MSGMYPVRASEKNPPHTIHTFDAVGTFNANCVDCQNMAKAVARYISPQLVALVLQDKKDREKRLKDIDDALEKLEAEKRQIKLDINRGYGENV